MTLTLLNNRYQIIRALASGGFGQTFLAEDTHLPSRRRCVIKQLKPVTNNPQVHQMVQARFQREAAILEKLGESNDQIPRLYAYFEESGQFYLVQEWIEGQTLTDKVQGSGVLSDRTVQNILLSILPVLDYVHSQGIIHRDVKPDNIILRQRDGKPVLIDFGAVKEVMTTVVNSQGNPTHSIVIGSPGFMPSEQTMGRPIYSSDLYSLGLTAVYLLTGKIPQELGMDSQTGEFMWRQYAPNVSPKLAAVLDKAIQSHPRDRYSTARQMLDDLESAPTPKPASPAMPSQEATWAVSPQAASPRQVQIAHPSAGSNEWKKAAAIAASIIGAAFLIGIVFARSRQPSPTAETAPEQPIVRRTPTTEPIVSPSPEITESPPPVASTPRAPRTTAPSPLPPVVAPPPPPEPTTTFPPSPPVVSSPPPVASRTSQSPPEEATSPPAAAETPSPTSTSEQPEQEQSASNLPRGSIRTFPVGTYRDDVESNLGKPNKDRKGAYGDTRAVTYEDYVPGEVSLGYLFDRQSGKIRQTEIAVAQSVELEQIQATLDEMLGGGATDEIKRKLRRVYNRESDSSPFRSGGLEGVIQRNNKDRIYIGVWDKDLH